MKQLKTTLLSGIAILMVAFISACNQNQANKGTEPGTKYYRNILFSETPWDIEKGARELTPEEAADVNSYKFVYDNEGRLLSVEFVRGDELLSYGSLDGAAKITYEYSGNKQMKHFFDENNQPVESEGVYRTGN